ncbi:MAG: GNAT family N-acetyltransferase [Phascolarctobacterium sp.]|uniref:GNAT family N-acetyltransferase n=1 Tax=Phascolarctobacterium sp. TaxID=2049039 RepID=UPI0026DC03F2|nr:GNAT family N-acetyltransferase [Phascolarctobacterium sp.]MDO4920845.1 GNAT family N-acetyltransferase [Phascolarctobacterium sp.]
MRNKICLRLVEADDAPGLAALYAPFVESDDRRLSDVSFEYVAPSVAEFRQRIADISADYPYLVCQRGGEYLGYAYAHQFIPRAAYQWGAEVTIYLAPAGQGCGLGKVLYDALENILRLQGVVKAYACVTASNEHSVKFHEARGYRIVGTFKDTGFKHGHWLDMVWLEKALAELPREPQPLAGWRELQQESVAKILEEANQAAAGLP